MGVWKQQSQCKINRYETEDVGILHGRLYSIRNPKRNRYFTVLYPNRNSRMEFFQKVCMPESIFPEGFFPNGYFFRNGKKKKIQNSIVVWEKKCWVYGLSGKKDGYLYSMSASLAHMVINHLYTINIHIYVIIIWF